MKKTVGLLALLALVLIFVVSCATSTSTSVKAVKGGSINKQSADSSPAIKKIIAVRKFTTELANKNQSTAYANAAYETLVNKLQGTGKFIIFEESAYDELNEYRKSAGSEAIQKNLAQYMIVGQVNSVANKTTGGSAFGISTKKTTVEASVTLRLIDTSTGTVLYAEEGQGNSNNSSTSVGFGGLGVSAGGYDPSSLEAKAIGAAIDSLINNMIKTIDKDPWQSQIFADSGNYYLIGGETMGISAGDVFAVYKKGGVIRNPQTGAEIELPGELVGEASVVQTFPAAQPENEISLITLRYFVPQETETYYAREN